MADRVNDEVAEMIRAAPAPRQSFITREKHPSGGPCRSSPSSPQPSDIMPPRRAEAGRRDPSVREFTVTAAGIAIGDQLGGGASMAEGATRS